ncbi:hypothetical protein LOK49_LG13G01411 [Camellia lanceoleosa]|uniref:Uncharacterized protein n=1 Tax=Camellia lanceoleosa TaxID=1840588 RepID=A0ACC0FGJ4_9ERIC|nr:hypothetical protein LOK49_LG13G01411 [Camellia lanceoleosa]
MDFMKVSSISRTNPPQNPGISTSTTQPLSTTTHSKLAGQIARTATIFRIDEGFAKATCNFTTLIGQGAFGPVYKAQMLTSKTIVVKVLATDSKQGAKEFQQRLVVLVEAAKAQFSHDYNDHLALVRAYEGWKEAERDVVGYEYCWKNFLSAQSIKAIDALRREFYSSLKEYVLNFNARWM